MMRSAISPLFAISILENMFLLVKTGFNPARYALKWIKSSYSFFLSFCKTAFTTALTLLVLDKGRREWIPDQVWNDKVEIAAAFGLAMTTGGMEIFYLNRFFDNPFDYAQG